MSIEISEATRDDVPVLLRGLHHLYTQDELFEEVMTLLETHVAPNCDHSNERPGMTIWNMLVLATMVVVLIVVVICKLQVLVGNQHVALTTLHHTVSFNVV